MQTDVKMNVIDHENNEIIVIDNDDAISVENISMNNDLGKMVLLTKGINIQAFLFKTLHM